MRLSHRLTLVFSLFGAVLAGGFQYNHLRVARQELHSQMAALTETTLKAVRAVTQARAQEENFSGLGRNLRQIGRDGLRVFVARYRGRRLDRRWAEPVHSQKPPDIDLLPGGVKDGFYDIGTSFTMARGERWTVQMGFPTAELDARMRELGEDAVRSGVMAFLTITLAAWVMGTGLGSRLEILVPMVEGLPKDPEGFRPLRGASSADEYGRLVAAFNRLGEILKGETSRRRDLEREKQELSAMLVHDLKTPLTVIHSGISLLQDQLQQDVRSLAKAPGRNPARDPKRASDSERQAAGEEKNSKGDLVGRSRRRFDGSNRRTFELLRLSADRLHRMVEDVLQLARMEEVSGLRESVPVDLALVARACAKDFEIIAADREQNFSLKVPEKGGCTVQGDPGLLRRVLDNLVHNAVEHTPAGQSVAVEVKASEGGRVRVNVSDSGPGIPVEARPDIFRKFFQKDVKRHVGNVGLGLAFCEKAVLRHGGIIGVEDAEPKGARFFFSLPEAAAATPAPAETAV